LTAFILSGIDSGTTGNNSMPEQVYAASKSRSNRPGWSVSFRHPLRNDARGKPGLKMRRGLGTSDDNEADDLVSDMNAILSDPSLWSASKRAEAERRFAKNIVNAFYDEIQAGRENPVELREECIRLPNAKDDGYSNVLFVGTTGAGKTSLLQQMIGSDPNEDRFPSTAPAKTTIADIEVIQSEGNFEAVVTFFSEFQTQANIEECVIDAALATHEGAAIDKIADRFLNHRDQRFRLSYILGSWNKASEAIEDDEFSFDGEQIKGNEDDPSFSDADREENRLVLASFVERVSELAKGTLQKLSNDLDLSSAKNAGSDREAAEELIEENFESYLTQDERFHELVQDVLDAIRSRFELIKVGELRQNRSGWPQVWQYQTSHREEFISQIRWFSSNYWPEFGRLLTPLVGGIRVKGPLFPSFANDKAKLVLIDGQGLGHTPDSSSSVTTHVTKKFGEVDVILLVDNAQQPMQAAPLSVLRSVVSSGHNSKLAIAFTHFDQIKGQNLRSAVDKRAHVLASVLNAMSNLREVLGAPIVRSIEHGIERRCFMLGGVDQNIGKLPAKAADYMRGELARIIEFCEEAIRPPPPPEARPVYDPTGISFAVREAISKFQGPWLARLGLATYEGISKEHWTRIKALNKRIAGELNPDYEYDTLRPVADLVARMTEAISRFLDEPIGWTRTPVDGHEEQSAISEVRRLVSAVMHDMATRRLVQDHLGQWRAAYDFSGTGSTFRRARTIEGIYEDAAPLPDAVMPPPSKEFLMEVRRVITGAIEASGGRVQLESDG
jgi:hypothetical protein